MIKAKTAYNKFKESIKKNKNSECKLLRSIYFGFSWMNKLMKFIFSSSFRGQSISKILYKKHFHQFSHYTEENRYPDLFEICRNYLSGEANPEILSFGCSTGEEVFSLGGYLPNAKITGADISDWCIRECLKKNTGNRYNFLHSKSGEFGDLKKMNAIFCLAVFQDPNNREPLTKVAKDFTFSQFEKQLIELDKKLNHGGLLIIDQCDFDFRETELWNNYTVLKVENNTIKRERPVFNRDNERVSEITFIPRVFVKR